MMVNEFIERTQYHPTAEEYNYIEKSYMESNLDKDEFCRRWKNLNREMVGKQIEERNARQRKAEKTFHLRADYQYKMLTNGIVASYEHEVPTSFVNQKIAPYRREAFWRDVLSLRRRQTRVYDLPFSTEKIQVKRLN